MDNDLGNPHFPIRLMCKESTTWHQCAESARIYAKREGLSGCCLEKLDYETGEYRGVVGYETI